jgi:hypothetical protein
MSVLSKLAISLGRRDEEPNQELARQLALSEDKFSIESGIRELIEGLKHKDSAIQSDCIKVLYELGMLQPDLIAPHVDTFLKLLNSKQNRLSWGAMIALHAIAEADPDGIYAVLPQILDAADHGSVITRDHAVAILAILGKEKRYAGEAIPLLIVVLKSCPVNQLPSYAEIALSIINSEFKAEFVAVLRMRLPELKDLPAKQKRVEKVLKMVG